MECKFNTKCEQCGDYYEANRTTSKYCSSVCRKLAFQQDKVSVPEVSVPLSVPANPLALPGDPDYAGCCEQVEGQWRVKSCPKSESLQLLTPSLLDTLPVGVTRPTGQPNERTQAMTGENLNRRLIGVKVWQHTPEYAEVVHRLLSGKTEGMNLPTWAVA